MAAIPFPPFPTIPNPVTWTKGGFVDAAQLRSDVYDSLLLLTQPPLFVGAQTGLAQAFTYTASTGLITSSITPPNGTTVILSNLTGTAFIVNNVYYVVNSGTATPGTFQLATTAGGPAITGFSNGTGTIQQTQVIGPSAWTPITLDTGITDAWQMHLSSTNAAVAFGMLDGLYLATATVAANYTGGAGTISAGITTQQGAALPATFGGARMPNSGTSGQYAQASAVKLLSFSVTGSYGAVGNNNAAAAVYQTTGASITPLASATRYASLTLEWVAGLNADPTVPVPDNDAWPVAPDTLGRSFLNRNVRDAIKFLSTRPCCEASYNAGTFSLASQSSLPSVGTAIPLDTVVIDNRATATQAQFSTGTSKWTCLYPGQYDVTGQHASNGASTSVAVAAGITVTSVNYNSGSAFTVWSPPQAAAGSGEINSAIVRRTLRLAYGDTLKLAGWQSDSGSNAATCPGGVWQPRLITVFRTG